MPARQNRRNDHCDGRLADTRLTFLSTLFGSGNTPGVQFRQGSPSAPVYAHRIAGPNRYQTAVCVSSESWFDPGQEGTPEDDLAHAVVLARGDMFPDALAGAPLATQMQGPLLLTTPMSLRPEVKAEILRVLPSGDPVSVTDPVALAAVTAMTP